MTTTCYRIESTYPIVGPLVAGINNTAMYIADRTMAIVMAAKSYTLPFGQEIRVVHVPTGEVVFRKTESELDLTI